MRRVERTKVLCKNQSKNHENLQIERYKHGIEMEDELVTMCKGEYTSNNFLFLSEQLIIIKRKYW